MEACMWRLKKSLNKAGSREQIAIKEVRDSILVLPQNQYRMILQTSSVNFELKSEAEQDVLIDNFQTFLNSLPNSLQILIRIRELDVDDYIGSLEGLKLKEDQPVYQKEIDNYADFIKTLISGNKILSRQFYIILPFEADKNSKDFQLARVQLQLTADLVIKALEKLSMKATQLNSLEILKLFYNFYNQGQVKTQSLTSETIKTVLADTYA
jgi:hypothetical protein